MMITHIMHIIWVFWARKCTNSHTISFSITYVSLWLSYWEIIAKMIWKLKFHCHLMDKQFIKLS